MKKNNHVWYTLPFILAFILFFGLFQTVEATENGGAVQTKGQITFLENDSSSSDSTTDSSSSSESVASSSTNSSQSNFPTKPKGRYPSTGELVKRSLSISGILLLLIAFILYLLKRNNQAKRRRGENEKNEN